MKKILTAAMFGLLVSPLMAADQPNSSMNNSAGYTNDQSSSTFKGDVHVSSHTSTHSSMKRTKRKMKTQ